ncbi:hypothetical protein MTO96_029236 [Rhipicephalus appendiculatus]
MYQNGLRSKQTWAFTRPQPLTGIQEKRQHRDLEIHVRCLSSLNPGMLQDTKICRRQGLPVAVLRYPVFQTCARIQALLRLLELVVTTMITSHAYASATQTALAIAIGCHRRTHETSPSPYHFTQIK